ncbi:MAG: Abortive infection protein [Myxococcaceae bacterium]|nr:Abortive infection protein [Myxococcaceae bacterium]
MTSSLETSAVGPVAPRWHTALLVALYLSVAVVGSQLPDGGAAASALPGGHGRVVARYLPLLLVQWGTLFYVARVGRPRSALRALLGAPWSTARRAAVDLALAAAGWVAIRATELAWAQATAGGSAPSVAALLPRTAPELLAWAVVSASVGFCEEVVFRGYLLTQFEAFTGRAWVAVLLQAALFGLAHGEQGPSAMLRAAFYGVGFGALARWRRSLAPGIVCHVATDLASGLLR